MTPQKALEAIHNEIVAHKLEKGDIEYDELEISSSRFRLCTKALKLKNRRRLTKFTYLTVTVRKVKYGHYPTPAMMWVQPVDIVYGGPWVYLKNAMKQVYLPAMQQQLQQSSVLLKHIERNECQTSKNASKPISEQSFSVAVSR